MQYVLISHCIAANCSFIGKNFVNKHTEDQRFRTEIVGRDVCQLASKVK